MTKIEAAHGELGVIHAKAIAQVAGTPEYLASLLPGASR